MKWPAMRIYCLLLIVTGSLLSLSIAITVKIPATRAASSALQDFPSVDPSYIYQQLSYVTQHFLHREAGYDTNLPPNQNGHDEFASYWSQEMGRDLHGFGLQIRRDPFAVQGWQNRSAPLPAFNVEASVPGITHPEQEVIIGCHYDGEAVSTQSAYDDASGCAIELGVAQALGQYWRSRHVYPARTLRFVIFDAEEQGVFGSFHYVNATIKGDNDRIVAMFNEEQNGIAYPLRYLGQLSNPLLPFYIDVSPLQNNTLYINQSQLTPTQRANITHFRALMQQAVPTVFQQFQALGYRGLTYHVAQQQDSPQPVFSADQLKQVHIEDDINGGSDQIPFTLAGLPCATFLGNATYYDTNPPPWSYPFDQKADTLQLMNTFASGGSGQSQALTLALALPGMITTWMLHQPGILGEASGQEFTTSPVVALDDIGQPEVGHALTLSASVPYASQQEMNRTSFTWQFGDGSSATGASVKHTYNQERDYSLVLTVSSPKGTRHITRVIHVPAHPSTYRNPYTAYISNGYPPSNSAVHLPAPNDALSDKIIHTDVVTAPATRQTAFQHFVLALLPWLAGIAVVIVIGMIVIVLRRRYKHL